MSETRALRAQRAAAVKTLRLLGRAKEAERLEAALPPAHGAAEGAADAADVDSTLSRTEAGLWLAALGLALTLSALWFFVLRPPDYTVTASGTFGDGDAFRPALGVDGEVTTEWIAPQDEAAWIEVRFAEPIDVDYLHVKNSWNPPYADRAIRHARLALYRGDALVAETELDFPRLERGPAPVEVALAGEGIDRIRLEADTWHRRGVALSELDWF